MPVTSKTAPPLTRIFVELPMLSLLVLLLRANVPLLIVIGPLKELAAERVNVPEPSLVNGKRR